MDKRHYPGEARGAAAKKDRGPAGQLETGGTDDPPCSPSQPAPPQRDSLWAMSAPAPEQQEAGEYELRINGHLDYGWAEWFEGLVLTHQGNGTTTLRGTVTDQAALHGLLTKVRDLGVTLISVQAIDCHPTATSKYNPTNAAAGHRGRHKET
jgi:hypothetical protein